MGNLHLVTGHAGTAHVTAADHGSLHAAIFGVGQYVLNRGSKFATTIISNNRIRVADGDIIMQGRHVRLNEGTFVDLTIENGTQGLFRNDLIVARYTKDSVSGVEDCNLVVIKGTASAVSATDPEYTAADIINDHVLLADMPLYRVPLDGLNVQPLVQLFTQLESVGDVASDTNAKATEALNKASQALDTALTTFTATATILASGWYDNASVVEYTLLVDGILPTDEPIIDMAYPSHSLEYMPELIAVEEEFAKIYFAVTGQDTMWIRAKDRPEKDIPIKIKVVR